MTTASAYIQKIMCVFKLTTNVNCLGLKKMGRRKEMETLCQVPRDYLLMISASACYKIAQKPPSVSLYRLSLTFE